MDWIVSPEIWVALVTLTALEIILGIDNVIFISVLTGRLPKDQQASARKLGLLLAMGTRLALLFSLFWLTKLTAPLFTVAGEEVSIRDLVLILGGLFLMAKSTVEIHHKMESGPDGHAHGTAAASWAGVIIQIAIIDIVFSLDSVITAIGMTEYVGVMAAAIIIAIFFMMGFAGIISHYVDAHPTLKVLALSFLILIGVALVGEGLGMHVPKGYIYFAMTYALAVEMINMRMRRSRAEQHRPA
ncbi:MAG TPA: TerC family protein [Gammaproteobacteria bacterium]|jgi:predicted tellurium resistance membrane protein TerC